MKSSLINLIALIIVATISNVHARPAVAGPQKVMVIPTENAQKDSMTGSVVKNQYLVKLKESNSAADHFSSFLDGFISRNKDTELIHKYNFESFQGYSIKLSGEKSLSELKSHDSIEAVELDAIASIAEVQNNAPWNLARISRRQRSDDKTYEYPDNAGDGVDVYVVDTGIHTSHREFAGRAEFGASFVRNDKAPGDPHGHGSHVAGIAVSNRYGVAKKSRAIAVKVLDKNGRGPWSVILAGLDWACGEVKKRGRRAVINMSISGGYSKLVNDAVNAAVKSGCIVVVAAGNNAVDACKESPASASSAITVGATNADDKMAGFSNFGSCVDIMAPGENIISTWTNHDLAAAYMSGTSMAAPHVSGVVALVLSYKQVSPDEAIALLRQTSTKDTIDSIPKSNVNYLLYIDAKADMCFAPSFGSTLSSESFDRLMRSSLKRVLKQIAADMDKEKPLPVPVEN